MLLGGVLVCGCASLNQGKKTEGNEQVQALTRQNQEIFQRAENLSKDNEEQLSLIAQVEQLKKQAEEKAKELENTNGRLTSEITKLQEELQQKELKVQSLTASFQRQSTVTITPNNSLLKQTPVLSIEGVSVLPRDGDTIRISVSDVVLFHPNTTQLLPASDSVLNDVLNEIRVNYPNNVIGIEGHTDSVIDNPQNPMYAIDLSYRKAGAVAGRLIELKKIAVKQLKTTGFGSSRPVYDNKTPEGRAKNNRVEFVIYP